MEIDKAFNGLLDLVRNEIFGNEISTQTKNLITEEFLKDLYKLSRAHDLAHIVGDSLDRNGLIDENSEAGKHFLKEREKALFRVVQNDIEMETLFSVFDGANISYIPLKGAVIRPLYPEPWMRTSCDVDVLVKKEDLQRAMDVLETQASYQKGNVATHDASVYSPSGVHVELHYDLTDSDSKPEERALFDKVWEVAKKTNGERYEMPEEVSYAYFISHMAKHVRFGGCGIRSFIDLWLINHKTEFDREKREETLKKCGLLKFSQCVERLSNVWFGEEEGDELACELAEYVLKGGVYGSFENRVQTQQAFKNNKFTYLFSRIFLPYSVLKFRFPILQKHKWLFPFCQVARWFKMIFNKERKEQSFKELKKTMDSSSDSQSKAKTFLDNIGL